MTYKIMPENEFNKPLFVGCLSVALVLLCILTLIAAGIIYVLVDLMRAVNYTFEHGM